MEQYHFPKSCQSDPRDYDSTNICRRLERRLLQRTLSRHSHQKEANWRDKVYPFTCLGLGNKILPRWMKTGVYSQEAPSALANSWLMLKVCHMLQRNALKTLVFISLQPVKSNLKVSFLSSSTHIQWCSTAAQHTAFIILKCPGYSNHWFAISLPCFSR